jgi:uncharacterized protein (TIGR00251 family)
MQTLPPWIRVHGEGFSLALRVQPGAPRAALLGPYGERLKVAIPAPPVDGRANESLLRFLAECLQLRASMLHLTAGTGARDKLVRVECDPALATELAARLAALMR